MSHIVVCARITHESGVGLDETPREIDSKDVTHDDTVTWGTGNLTERVTHITVFVTVAARA